MRILRILSHLNSKRSHNPQQKRADVDVTRFGDQPNIDREYLSRMSRDALDYEGQ